MKYFISFLILMLANVVQAYPKIEIIKDNDNYLMVQERSLPIIDVNITFDFGSKDDLSNKGITNFAFELLHQQKHQDKKYINIFEGIGAQYSSSVSRESSSISLRFINTNKNLEIISDSLGKMLVNRIISNETFELTKEAILKNIKSRDLDPAKLLSYKSNEEYFNNSSLAHPVSGYKQNIINISIKEIINHLNNILIKDDIKISFVGDINKNQAISFISRILIMIPQGNIAKKTKEIYNYSESSKVVEINHDSEQTHISIMIPSVNRKDKDFYNILVANYIFGGSGFGSMLMDEIRVKNGLAYSVFSYLMPYKDLGIIKIGMQTEAKNTQKALDILSEQLEIFQEFDIDEEKIELAKLGLLRSFELRFDTNKKILSTLAAINNLDMHENYFDKYIHGIKKVNKASIHNALKTKIKFNNQLIITVGKN